MPTRSVRVVGSSEQRGLVAREAERAGVKFMLVPSRTLVPHGLCYVEEEDGLWTVFRYGDRKRGHLRRARVVQTAKLEIALVVAFALNQEDA